MDAGQLRRCAGLVLAIGLVIGGGLAGRGEARAATATTPVHVSNCRSRSDCGAPIKGGLQITFTGWACTTGFLARDLHTGKLYAITAGHCLARSGLLALWSHHGRGIGHATLQAFREGSGADAGAIEVDQVAVTNEVYASSNEDIRHVEAWAADRDHLIGSAVCRSGATSGWTCGHIVAADVSTKIDGLPIRHSWWTDFPSATGDSGGPLFGVDGRLLGIAIATTSTQTVYSTIEAIAAELNVSPCVTPSCA
jgi:streptogrisin C